MYDGNIYINYIVTPRDGFDKVVLLVNNLNFIKKHVEDISVDAVSGCKFCSVVIYDPKYNIKKYIILPTVISPYHHYHSGDINWVLQVIL